ncbi:uncharacterized protein Z520_08376 [Fonsecaea multimorphosa CBS 102226]|uniref:Mid2 domain-containing protein n=1 Tax=Fonsecaea multimorphosa CBS 102226 TaxID=1442371 RepID=A0A0D2IGD8_9EURO|nr:uncharacterized protein Z520_08376 [Fonsecaea multimorphosa CBS 102226]KIX96121.1 hypothetical protein Z520_08376 [Fonsecaea multimorphosa CBS 102226]OAL19147.1 hypothetical protein AYO22_10095 [Fonsecaea multimorphosa]
MKYHTRACTLRTFLVTSAFFCTSSAFQIVPTPALFRRDDSCSAVDPKLPNSFSCASGNNCISLDNSSSALCCPESSSCDNIQTISCDISSQNATANPTAGIFTTRLGDKLPQCGDSCCPFGYSCMQQSSGPSICSIIQSTSIVGKTDGSSGNLPSSSSTSSSATKSATSSPSTTKSTSTSSPSSGSVSAAQVEPQCNKFPIGVFLAGFFPGMFVGAFLMLAWVICSGRHRKPNSRDSSGSSIYKPTISDPIPLDASGGRTDFLRKTTDRAKSMFSAKSNRNSQQSAPSHWKMPTPPVPNNIPVVPAGIPVTPERRLAHEPSMESIKVYTPPAGSVQHPNPAAIAPLRGMAAQRFPLTTKNNMGSPFQSPPNNGSNGPNTANRMSSTLRNERGVSVFSGESELSAGEDGPTLTPARYNGGFNPAQRMRSESRDEISRPNTTFTEMLHEAGFPDPMQPPDQRTPAVPKIPEGYAGRSYRV